MTLYQAMTFIMPMGKYKGRKLLEIAATDPGLLYLGKIVGDMRISWMADGDVDLALVTFLEDPPIRARLDEIRGRIGR